MRKTVWSFLDYHQFSSRELVINALKEHYKVKADIAERLLTSWAAVNDTEFDKAIEKANLA